MTAQLDVRNLEVSYANGAGKTSLVRAIAGMLRPSGGQVLFNGIDITGLESSETCELGIGQVAEGRQIFPTLTIDENLQLGGALRRSSRDYAVNLERVFDLFPRLVERRSQKAGTLSGGEQQMLAIGRCLMSNPIFIMFDEPSLGLSPLMVELVFNAILKLKESGMTILLIEQNVAESLALADFATVLESGKVVLAGTATDVAGDDGVRRAYLGL
jgi:branched-chain amino acid transport system ATP-binding protein